jgi:hypothetical protein
LFSAKSTLEMQFLQSSTPAGSIARKGFFTISCQQISHLLQHRMRYLFSTSTSIQGSDWNLDFLNDSPAVAQVQHLVLSQSFWERLNWNLAYTFLVDRIRKSKVLQSVTIVGRDKGAFSRDGMRLADVETERCREGLEGLETRVGAK